MPPPAIVAEISDRLPREIGEDNIRKYFLLTHSDLQQVRRCRGNSNRLGFAVQLCTLRWRGYFFPDTSALPLEVLEFLAPQVKTEAVQIPEYPQNEKTRWEHLDRMRSHLRFEKCDEARRQLLFNHLKTQAVLMPRASALYDEACSWLFGQRIVRPGYTTVRETVAASKEAALNAVYDQLSAELDAAQKQRLYELLNASPSGNDDTPVSQLEQNAGHDSSARHRPPWGGNPGSTFPPLTPAACSSGRATGWRSSDAPVGRLIGQHV
jgi:hypothetical protein